MRKKKAKMSKQEADLRLHGFMTIEEFTAAYNIGLRLYLEENWSNVSSNELHHPEDLAANALSYAEATFSTISIFGVNGAKFLKEEDED